MATKKIAPVALALFVHAERMSWDPTCVFLTVSVELTEADRRRDDGPRLNDPPTTKLGASMRLQNLGFVVIVSAGGDPKSPRVSLEYRDVHTVDAHAARAMVRTLDAWEKKTRALNERFGWTESFGASLRRACDVLGVTEIRFSKTAAALAKVQEWSLDSHGCATATDMDAGTRIFERAIERVCSPETADATREVAS